MNEHEEMPPMHDQATEDKINEDGRLKAENNLKDLQEKLKILEDIMGADPNGGTPEVISLLSVEEETEPIEGENDEEVPELEERADENTKETAKGSFLFRSDHFLLEILRTNGDGNLKSQIFFKVLLKYNIGGLFLHLYGFTHFFSRK